MTMRKPQIVPVLLLMAVTLLGGCANNAGPIFPKSANLPAWPAAPDPPRIRYVGQLTGSADLKPAVSGFNRLGSAVFGADQTYTFANPMAVCTDGASRVFVADTGDPCHPCPGSGDP